MSPINDLAAASVRLLINLTLLGSAIAISIAVSLRLTRGASTRVRYVAAVITFFIAALLPIAVTLAGARARSPLESSSIANRTSSDAMSGDKIAPASGSDSRSSIVSSTVSDRMNSLAGLLANSQSAVVLLFVWAAGAVLLLGREFAGHLFLRKARREWQPAAETVRRELSWPDDIPLFVDAHEPPSTIGLLRPAVVLPLHVFAELPPASALRIARHELAHAKWRDPLINALLRIVRAALWPCVPLWFLERMVHAEREASADQAAVDCPSSSKEFILEAADYAASLVSIARRSQRASFSGRHGLVATQVNSGAAMEQRIKRLFNSGERLSRARLAFGSAVFFCGIACTVFLPVVVQTFDSDDGHNALESSDRQLARTSQAQRGGAGTTQASEWTDRLIAALKGRDWQVRGEVAEALRQIKNSGAVEPLIAALQNEDWRTREKAAWALGMIKSANGVEPLIVRLKDGDSRVQHTVAWALGMIGDRRAVELLLTNLNARPAEARQGAAWALGMIGDARAVEPLIDVLKNGDSDVRHSAAWALGMIGDERAVEPLTAALQDSNDDVRQVAAKSLERLRK